MPAERDIIDRLVNAVIEGDADGKAELAAIWLGGVAEHDWRRWRIVDEGFFLSMESLDPSRASPIDIVNLLERYEEVSEKRLRTLRRGGPLNRTEAAIWRHDVIERAFSPEYVYELGTGTRWVVVELKHSKRGRCCVGVLDWNGPRECFVAAYITQNEVANALKARGYINHDDYKRRSGVVPT
jgi:hypothetical protein